MAEVKLLKDLLEKGALNSTGLVNRYLDQIEKHAKPTPQSLLLRLSIRNAKRGLLGALIQYSYYNQSMLVFTNFHPGIFYSRTISLLIHVENIIEWGDSIGSTNRLYY
jgi:hypothetical protein